MSERYDGPVTEAEIAALAARLEEWGESLPSGERELLQLMVSRARLVSPDDVFHAQIEQSVSAAAREAFASISDRWAVAAYWDKIGPIWQKANPAEFGEDVEILTRISFKPR